MAVKVKICGLTNEKDAVSAVNLGADFLGFNFWSGSPRKVSPALAAEIIAKIPPFVSPVGIFVDHPVDEILKIVSKTGVKGIQLHGDQSPEDCRALKEKLDPGVFVCKAFRVKESADLAGAEAFKELCSYFLVDARVEEAPGGTGQRFPWELAADLKAHGLPVFAAGGLTPENVSLAVETIRPFGVDVAGGVEKSPKRKDYDKMKSFIEAARSV
ncbi:MAG: phosphoribosylanthranilate isomerase [Elusimicrobiota bacterium]